jgi:TonB family protein
LDLNTVSLELRTDNRRNFAAFASSVLIHLVIFILFFLPGKPEVIKEKKIVVMEIKFADKFQEDMTRVPDDEVKKVLNDQKKVLKNIEKQLEKRKKDLVRSMVQDKTQEKKSNVSVDEKSDIFKEYDKTREKEKKDIEKSFFTEDVGKISSDEKKSELSDLDKKLAELDSTLKSLDNNSGGRGTGDSDTRGGTKKGPFEWEGSNGRELVYKTPLKVSKEFEKEGVKTSIKLRFTVLDSGLISGAEVLVSTGYSELDRDIIDQFKQWRFQEIKGMPPVYGIFESDIVY